MKFLKKNYKVLNIVFLLFSIYVILFPFIPFPVPFECPYLKLTGNPCPFCGGTRFVRNIFHENIFSPFGIMILFVIFEIIFRTILLIKKISSEKIIKIDLIIHIIAIILLVSYEIWFFVH